MRKVMILGLKLFLIAAVAGLALGMTNKITAGAIAEQQVKAAETARRAVVRKRNGLRADRAGGLERRVCGYDANGKLVGKTERLSPQATAVKSRLRRVDNDGVITGISVGGSSFSETAGLGARSKEAWFAEQYIGKESPIALKKDGGEIDAITSATITSRAVTKAVNSAVLALGGLTPPTEG